MKEQYNGFYLCTVRGAEKLVKGEFWLLELMQERKEKLFKHQDA